jgi:hypothetical protein
MLGGPMSTFMACALHPINPINKTNKNIKWKIVGSSIIFIPGQDSQSYFVPSSKITMYLVFIMYI